MGGYHSNSITEIMYEEDGDVPVGSYAIFFAEGESLAKQKEYKKAIESFTKVAQLHFNIALLVSGF